MASSALDDASAKNLAALEREADLLIKEQSAAIDRACELLAAPDPPPATPDPVPRRPAAGHLRARRPDRARANQGGGPGGAPEARSARRAYRRAMTTTSPALDEERLQALLGQAVVELGATAGAALVVIGDRLGLYRALADHGPMTPAELAERTGTAERYVREWLNAQAASGWVDYDAIIERYGMSPEQALMFADPESPAFVAGGFQFALGAPMPATASPTPSPPAPASAGTNTSTTCSTASPVLRARLPREPRAAWIPPSRASTSARARRDGSPTSAAARACRPS